MRRSNADPTFPARLGQLLDDAAKQALFLQQAQPFFDWFQAEVRICGPQIWPDTPVQELRGLAHHLGTALWNQLPLPRNRFRPEPLPKPERNDRCPCGSGSKYKHCCGARPASLPLDAETVWQLALPHISREQLREAIAHRQIPVMTLGALADEQLELGNGRQAVALLEPLFDAELASLNQRHAAVLNLLCNAYDEIYRRPTRKIKLLERLTAAPHKAVRANAWQRLASLRMDQGREDEAWRCFQEAQRADANDPDLAHLELLLLVARGEHARARERARFWLHQYRRQGIDDPDRLDFLNAAVRDPASAFAELGRSHRDPHLLELESLARSAERLQLPAYRVERMAELDTDDAAAVAEHFRRSFRGMGIADGELEKHLPKLQRDLKKMKREPTPSEEPDANERRLVPPPDLVELEARWREIYPVGKPHSTQPMPAGDPWTEPNVNTWMSFLKTQPQSLSSFDVLDDLLMAADLHGQDELPGVYQQIAAPLLDRALRILQQAVPGEGVTLPWGMPENRPALRLLSRQINLLLDRREDEAAAAAMERIIALNPNDNHGYRCMLINRYLRSGENERAVALWERYPGDWYNPEMSYGYALALYRLGRQDEAGAALREAKKVLPEVSRALSAASFRAPKLSELGTVTVGGKDQAAFYRADMLDAWKNTPGALRWLRQHR